MCLPGEGVVIRQVIGNLDELQLKPTIKILFFWNLLC